jgi:hypothetical protein
VFFHTCHAFSYASITSMLSFFLRVDHPTFRASDEIEDESFSENIEEDYRTVSSDLLYLLISFIYF